MSLQWRMMQNLKGKWLVVSKLTWEMRQVFTRALESLNDFHFNMLLLSKVYTVWGKKVQRSYIHDTEEWYKIWKEINLWFQNWHKEFNNFWPEHSKVSKILTCTCSFWTSYIFWARKVQTSYLSWHWRLMQNLKKKLSCGLENDMRNLTDFHQSTWNCQNWDFDGILLSKVENVWA